jgi:outer membrane protein
VGAPLGDHTLVGLTLGRTWANAPFMRSYYGVSDSESAQGGLPVYAPGAGWKDVSLALTGETTLTDRWKLSGQVLEARLTGGASSSPVSESRHEKRFSLTLWYEIR